MQQPRKPLKTAKISVRSYGYDKRAIDDHSKNLGLSVASYVISQLLSSDPALRRLRNKYRKEEHQANTVAGS